MVERVLYVCASPRGERSVSAQIAEVFLAALAERKTVEVDRLDPWECELPEVDGDLLAVHKTQEVRNGQVVVARLDEDVTVKRFQRKGSQVWLLPENEDLSPIEVDLSSQHLTIEGLAVGVIRNADWM